MERRKNLCSRTSWNGGFCHFTSITESRIYQFSLLRTSKELDLRNQQAVVRDFFAAEKPDYVFLAAAKVGGIVANNTYRAGFLLYETFNT